MNRIGFFNKKKKDREEFIFPTRGFEYERSKLNFQSSELLVSLIEKFEIYVTECEKSFKKSSTIYEDTKKSESKLTETIQKNSEKYQKEKLQLDEDLKSLRTGYHKTRNENDAIAKELQLLKRPASDSVEKILESVHTVVIELVKKSTADKSLGKMYEEAIVNAEKFFTQMENHFSDTKLELENSHTKNSTLEADMKNQQMKCGELQDDVAHLTANFAQKTVKLSELEGTVKDQTVLNENEVNEIKNRVKEVDGAKNFIQVEKDRADADAHNLRDDILLLTENFNAAKLELDAAHKIGFEKDQSIEEKKVMIKQLYNELKQEKKEAKNLRVGLDERAKELEALKNSSEIVGVKISTAGEISESGKNDTSLHSGNLEAESEKTRRSENLSVGGGRQVPKEDGLVLELTIQIENLKNTIFDLEDKLKLKEELTESLESKIEISETKIRDLENKRRNALAEIQNLKSKINDLSSNKKTPLSNPPLYEGRELRMKNSLQSTTPNRKIGMESPGSGNHFEFGGGSTMNLDNYITGEQQNTSGPQPLIINPKKFENFSSRISSELKDTYIKFIDMAGNGLGHGPAIEVEKGLNTSMQLVKGFTMYVNDKLDQLNLNPVGTCTKGSNRNMDGFEDFFKKSFANKK